MPILKEKQNCGRLDVPNKASDFPYALETPLLSNQGQLEC